MKVGTAIPRDLRCPHDNSAMEFGRSVHTDEPTWHCEVCEIDYTLTDLIREGEIDPSFVVME